MGYVVACARHYASRRRASTQCNSCHRAQSHAFSDGAQSQLVAGVSAGADHSSDHFQYALESGAYAVPASSSSFVPVSMAEGGVVELVAERVSLPSQAGTADLLGLLPEPEQRKYNSESNMLFDPVNDPLDAKEKRSKPPVTRLHGTQEEWVKLVKRMDALGMLDFTTKPKAVCGVFGVPKDGGASIRLIIDARPANLLFKTPPKVSLPTPDVLARMRASPGAPFFTAKADVDNFYHRLRCPQWLRPYFALPVVRAGEVSAAVASRFGADALVHPMCTTLPMGWSHSVYVAQCAHEWLLDRATSLAAADRLGCSRFNGDWFLRGSRVLHSVYIDDLALFSLCKDELSRVLAQYVSVACAHGLAVKQSKVCEPTCAAVEVLGLEVCGASHTIALAAAKLDALCTQTKRLVSEFQRRTPRVVGRESAGGEGDIGAGVPCTGLKLAHLIGRWTWAMLVNRPTLSVFSAVYRYVEVAGARRFALWPAAALELAVVAALAPLLVVRLSAPDYPSFIATDASERGQGVVVFTPRTDNVVLVAPARAQQPHKAENKQDPSVESIEARSQQPDAVCVPVDRAPWVPIVSSRWGREEHINVLELRALHTAVRWVLSHARSTGSRVSVLSDSTVVIGVVRKGRSSSRALLRRMRCMSAWVPGGCLQLDVQLVASEFNPADRPSRLYVSENSKEHSQHKGR